MNARLFKYEGLAKLRAQRRTDPSIIAGYEESGTVPLEEEWLFPSSLVSTSEEVPELTSECGQKQRPATDAENAIKIWEYLPDLRIHQATDERLWAWLCHDVFNEYCLWRVGRFRARKDGETEGDYRSKKIKWIESHWFLAGGRRALRRNAISRLWWAAYLTRSPWDQEEELAFLKREDPFHYTRLFLRNQDIYQGVMERKFGGSTRLRICALAVLDDVGDWSSAFITEFLKRINLASAYRDLGQCSPEELLELLSHLAGHQASQSVSSG